MHQGGWCIRTCRPLPSAPTLAQHARHALARGRAPFLRGASRAVRTSVPLASFALAGGLPASFRIFAPLPLLVRDGILPAVCECSGLVS